jgi:hypothetical protein
MGRKIRLRPFTLWGNGQMEMEGGQPYGEGKLRVVIDSLEPEKLKRLVKWLNPDYRCLRPACGRQWFIHKY